MKLRLLTNVVQGIKQLESQVNTFCDSVDVHGISASVAGAQVIVSVTYSSKEAGIIVPEKVEEEFEDISKPPSKRKRSKAKTEAK